jgi:hypothetical protein
VTEGFGKELALDRYSHLNYEIDIQQRTTNQVRKWSPFSYGSIAVFIYQNESRSINFKKQIGKSKVPKQKELRV